MNNLFKEFGEMVVVILATTVLFIIAFPLVFIAFSFWLAYWSCRKIVQWFRSCNFTKEQKAVIVGGSLVGGVFGVCINCVLFGLVGGFVLALLLTVVTADPAPREQNPLPPWKPKAWAWQDWNIDAGPKEDDIKRTSI